MQRVVARFSFSCTVLGNRPQSLTGHFVNRCRSLKGRDIMKKRGLTSKLHSSNQLTEYFQ